MKKFSEMNASQKKKHIKFISLIILMNLFAIMTHFVDNDIVDGILITISTILLLYMIICSSLIVYHYLRNHHFQRRSE